MTESGSVVLVTGGAGFIGTQLVRRLVGAGCDAHVVDNLHPQVHGDPHDGRYVPGPGHTFHAMDVRSAESWTALLRTLRPATIVHLAAETGTGQSLREASRHATTNVVGTTEMLDALTRTGSLPDRIILTSSRAVYGEGQWVLDDGRVFSPGARPAAMLEAGIWEPRGPGGEPARPAPNIAGLTPTAPTNVYAATKLAQEHVLSAWCSAMAVDLRVRRLQNVFGAGQSLGNPYTGVLTFFARLAAAGETIPVFEDGGIVRDFVHVGTVVAALERALEDDIALADVGSGEVARLVDVAATIAAHAGAPEPKITGQFRLGDVRAAGASDLADAEGVVSFLPHLDELLAWASSRA